MTDDELQAKLQSLSGGKLRVLLRYRYLALALAVNLPGNVILCGGGGIALMAGLSRLFDPLPFLLTILLAVLPVPMFFSQAFRRLFAGFSQAYRSPVSSNSPSRLASK
jgi:hypothetical protein